MGRLSDLRTALNEMDADELRDHIRFIREDRRKVKHQAKAPKARRQKKGNKITAAFKEMTTAEKLAFIQMLEGK